jgi:hypothetical protein
MINVAKRFPPKSKEALIRRLLAQTAVRRMKKLESVLNHSAETTKPQREDGCLTGDAFTSRIFRGRGCFYGLSIAKIDKD